MHQVGSIKVIILVFFRVLYKLFCFRMFSKSRMINCYVVYSLPTVLKFDILTSVR